MVRTAATGIRVSAGKSSKKVGGGARPSAPTSNKSGEILVPASSPQTHSPFINQTWEQIKEGIKSWIKLESEPSLVDIEMLGDHLRQMALDRRIEILQSGFNFLYRTFTDLSCSWHRAYFILVDAVQQGMVARYGKVLHLKTNFKCCEITN